MEEAASFIAQQGDAVAAVQVVATASMLTAAAAAAFFVHLLSCIALWLWLDEWRGWRLPPLQKGEPSLRRN